MYCEDRLPSHGLQPAFGTYVQFRIPDYGTVSSLRYHDRSPSWVIILGART